MFVLKLIGLVWVTYNYLSCTRIHLFDNLPMNLTDLTLLLNNWCVLISCFQCAILLFLHSLVSRIIDNIIACVLYILNV